MSEKRVDFKLQDVWMVTMVVLKLANEVPEMFGTENLEEVKARANRIKDSIINFKNS